MGREKKQEQFADALLGKKIPVLTLDNKWYRLLDETGRQTVKELEDELNLKLRRMGKLNTESKDIKKLKRKLMNEIVPMVDEAEQSDNPTLRKKIDEHKRLIEECNQKLESYQEELMDLPREIDQINVQLMVLTMEYCYDQIRDNTEQIEELEEWVKRVRIELKKNLVRKQELEQKNYSIYAYMNDIFGADVMDLFDMQYNPEEKHPTVIPRKPEKESAANT